MKTQSFLDERVIAKALLWETGISSKKRPTIDKTSKQPSQYFPTQRITPEMVKIDQHSIAAHQKEELLQREKQNAHQNTKSRKTF